MRKFWLICTYCLMLCCLQAQYCGNSGSVVCSPQGTYLGPGFYPDADSVPSFINNSNSTTSFQLQNFDTIVFGNQLLHVYSMRIDTIDNLPPGLCWATDQFNNTYQNSQQGCIAITGRPCGLTGQYKMRVVVTVDIGVQAQSDADPGGFKYYLRLKNSADPEIPIDITQTATNAFIPYGDSCRIINPIVLNMGSGLTVCPGSIASLSPSVSGGQPPYIFTWQCTGSSLNCVNCQNPVATVNQNSTFILTVTDAANGSITDSVQYSVQGTPINCNISANGPTSFCGAGNATLNADTNSNLNYQWKRKGINIAGANQSTYTATDTSGSYLLVYNQPGVCQAFSNIIRLNFFAAPVATIATLGTANLCAGGIVIMGTDSLPGLNYQWQRNGFFDSVYSSFNLATVAGAYNLIVSNAVPCADTSNTITVVDNANPAPSVTLLLSPDTVCYHSGAVVLSGGSPTGGSFSGAAVSAGAFNPGSAFVGANPVTYTYTDNNGCSASFTDNVFVVLCTGVNEVDDDNAILIFPNPADDKITVTTTRAYKQNATVTVFDMNGKQIELPFIQQAAGTTFNTNALAAGVYFLQWHSGDNYLTKKFIKTEP